MSVAKRDRGDDRQKPVPSNEDEGNENKENEQHRFVRTNQALKWAKGGLSDAKLYLYAKTGQIVESEDSTEVTEAFQKLDTYKEQIDSLLVNAENWTKSMLQTWNYQTNLIDALKECNSVIQTFHNRNKSHLEQKDNDEFTENQFAQIVKGISNELFIDQQESEKRYGHASKLLVVPLRNILNHEIQHAVDLKRKYIHHKRQFDNNCTIITNLKNKIQDIENPKKEETEKPNVGTFGKLKLGFGKLIQSNPTKQELENKLNDARSELPAYIKQFDVVKKQLLESINIVEEKLNIEVVYYVQQFYNFVEKWKSGNTPNDDPMDKQKDDGYNAEDDHVETEEDQNVQNEEELVFQAHDDNDYGQEQKEDVKLVKDLQIDSMMNYIMNNPEMDEVNLDEPNQEKNEHIKYHNPNDVDFNDVSSEAVNDDAENNNNDNVKINEIEISENHDVET